MNTLDELLIHIMDVIVRMKGHYVALKRITHLIRVEKYIDQW